jgi:hypothetical protein
MRQRTDGLPASVPVPVPVPMLVPNTQARPIKR